MSRLKPAPTIVVMSRFFTTDVGAAFTRLWGTEWN